MPVSSKTESSPPGGTKPKPTLRSLFETEETSLLRYAFSLTGRRAIAEEIVQDVFLQLHTHWEEVENPRAWLFRSVRNRAYNHRRDHRREILTDDDDRAGGSTSENETPEELLLRMEAAGFLRLMIAELEEGDRQLIHLKYFEDLKYRDISDRTGLKVGNVGYRLHHLLKQLAEKLRQLGIDGTS